MYCKTLPEFTNCPFICIKIEYSNKNTQYAVLNPMTDVLIVFFFNKLVHVKLEHATAYTYTKLETSHSPLLLTTLQEDTLKMKIQNISSKQSKRSEPLRLIGMPRDTLKLTSNGTTIKEKSNFRWADIYVKQALKEF